MVGWFLWLHLQILAEKCAAGFFGVTHQVQPQTPSPRGGGATTFSRPVPPSPSLKEPLLPYSPPQLRTIAKKCQRELQFLLLLDIHFFAVIFRYRRLLKTKTPSMAPTRLGFWLWVPRPRVLFLVGTQKDPSFFLACHVLHYMVP